MKQKEQDTKQMSKQQQGTKDRKKKIVGLSGSIRDGSHCKQIIDLALKSCGSNIDTETIDLETYSVPFRDGLDFQSHRFEDSHDDVQRFRDVIKNSDALIVCTPEYHSSYSGVLKNALDWLTGNELKGKIVGLMCCSSSDHPTLAISHLRDVFRSLGAWVIPDDAFIPTVHVWFNESGCMNDCIGKRIRLVGEKIGRMVMLDSVQEFMGAMHDDFEGRNIGALDAETAKKTLRSEAMTQRTLEVYQDITHQVFKNRKGDDKFVIIGGGFAGMKIAMELQNKFQVLLIDSKDYFEYTPGMPRVIIQPERAKELIIPYSSSLKDSFYQGVVSEVHKDHILMENNKMIKFDYLVVATGSRYQSSEFCRLPIKEEKAYANMKDQTIDSKNRIKQIEEEFRETEKAQTICVIGGGIVGCELLAEVMLKYPKKKFILIHAKDSLLNNVPDSKTCGKITLDLFKKAGAQVLLGQRVQKVEMQENNEWLIETNLNEKITANKVFFCTGIIPNTDLMKKSFSSLLDPNGLIQVTPSLSLQSHPNIFAIGDIISGINDLKTAAAALNQAGFIIENAERIKGGKRLEVYKALGMTPSMVISLSALRGLFVFEDHVVSTKKFACDAKNMIEVAVLKGSKQEEGLVKGLMDHHKKLSREMMDSKPKDVFMQKEDDEDADRNELKKAQEFIKSRIPAD